ncbi:hypothetical protein Ciccas_012260 [Cichlidogyrus casuarinus]|uniref:Nuclear receptor domain-containing protein n=1 Tax=Cichlidogyrus casuarinus TaxID=1844966 RepID=A0ABD2PQ43_9PLAT
MNIETYTNGAFCASTQGALASNPNAFSILPPATGAFLSQDEVYSRGIYAGELFDSQPVNMDNWNSERVIRNSYTARGTTVIPAQMGTMASDSSPMNANSLSTLSSSSSASSSNIEPRHSAPAEAKMNKNNTTNIKTPLLSSNASSSSTSKECKVCGDRAVNHNFGQLTCESCKAFFRRNAHKVSNNTFISHAKACHSLQPTISVVLLVEI